ncbi:MAG: hypothetical protein Q4F38_08210 [Akkermansia sp.]|nr:hypothetical protein [Akkermansia sp.]
MMTDWPVIEWLTFTPSEALTLVAVATFVVLVLVIVPVQISAKWRRIRLDRMRITCRICGYRFLRKDPEAVCPHCEAKNR